MNHALPLPEFKSAKPIVKCFNCGNKYFKSGMWKAAKITPTYLCDGCKNGYSGKLAFKKAGL
jgi:hypothetical protein